MSYNQAILSKMPGIDFQQVRKWISIKAVLELLDYKPTANVNLQWRGPCPIHGSVSPTSRSFSVSLSSNAFQCFSCGAKGNQLDLWSAVRELPLHEAAMDLCERMHVDIPWIERG
jgi:DNA primase